MQNLIFKNKAINITVLGLLFLASLPRAYFLINSIVQANLISLLFNMIQILPIIALWLSLKKTNENKRPIYLMIALALFFAKEIFEITFFGLPIWYSINFTTIFRILFYILFFVYGLFKKVSKIDIVLVPVVVFLFLQFLNEISGITTIIKYGMNMTTLLSYVGNLIIYSVLSLICFKTLYVADKSSVKKELSKIKNDFENGLIDEQSYNNQVNKLLKKI